MDGNGDASDRRKFAEQLRCQLQIHDLPKISVVGIALEEVLARMRQLAKIGIIRRLETAAIIVVKIERESVAALVRHLEIAQLKIKLLLHPDSDRLPGLQSRGRRDQQERQQGDGCESQNLHP